MKQMKGFGLAVAMCSCLFGVAGPASATTLTSPAGSAYTGEIHAVSEEHLRFDTVVANVDCSATATGKVESHGAEVTAKVALTGLATTCTNSWHFTFVSLGVLEVHRTGEGVGTVTSTGMTLNLTRFGVVCNLVTNNTTLGTLTDSQKTGGTATIHLEGKLSLHTGSSVLCGNQTATLTGSYLVTTPDSLYLDQ